MAGLNPNIEILQHGPLFNRPDDILNYHLNLMTTKLATDAKLAVKLQGQSSFRYEKAPATGQWARSIKTTAAIGGMATVSDSGIVYGPWLEGVGSRNFPVTRFKGYSMFRKVRDEIQRKWPQMLAPEINKMNKELEGT